MFHETWNVQLPFGGWRGKRGATLEKERSRSFKGTNGEIIIPAKKAP